MLKARLDPVFGRVELDFPLMAPVTPVETASQMQLILAGLGVTAKDVLFTGRSRDLLVQLTPEAFHAMDKLDLRQIALLDAWAIAVTCAYSKSVAIAHNLNIRDDTDFVSRFFCPKYNICFVAFYAYHHSICRAGIDEDPVTGSAHCELADFWSKKLNKRCMLGYQASRRGGYVAVTLTDEGRVLLAGDCVSVIRSSVLIL